MGIESRGGSFLKSQISNSKSEISDLKFNPLRQGERIGIVYRIGGPAHVGVPGVGAGLPPTAGFLFATERPADFGAAGADVHIRDPAIGPGRGAKLLRL